MLDTLKRFAAATLCAACALGSAAAAAQGWPTKPIRIINPYAPGGPSDILARQITQKMGESLGQPVVIESRAGGAGVIGADHVAKSPPDGHTLLFANIGFITILPALRASMPYDPVKDLDPITQLVSGPLVLLVRPDLPFRSVADVIAYAKANPGKLTYGSSGTGANTHLAGEMLGAMAGIRMLHVPFKGASQILTELLAGRIDLYFNNISTSMPYIQNGKLRGLAVTTLKRSSALPELPAVADGLPGYEVDSWYGVMAPAGTPKDIVNRVRDELVKNLRTPETLERLRQGGLDPVGSTPAEYAAKIREDLARWAKLVKSTGIKVE